MNTDWQEATLPLNAPSIVAPIVVPENITYPLPDCVDVWGTRFSILTMESTIRLADNIVSHRRPEYFVTANLNYLMLTEQNPQLSGVNEGAAAVIADGHPIVLRSRIGSSPLPCRVAGSDMIVELARMSAERGYRMFFLGAAPNIARAAASSLQHQFPNLQIAGCYSPPFRELSNAEHDDMLAQIRDSGTDILLVAFGQPKGEFWISENLQELHVPLSIQIGASFDFLAGTAKRAPRFWQRIGCEWLYRALSDPMRLAPRYSRNIVFLFKKILAELLAGNNGHKASIEQPKANNQSEANRDR